MMSPDAVFVDISCPSCSQKGVFLTSSLIDIPYIGTCIQTTIFCKLCGYKSAEVSPVDEREPVHIEFVVEKPEDLDARVVKSSHAKVIFKELGVEITPGPASETYISNVEGLIRRFEDVLDNLKPGLDGEELERCEELKRRIENVIEGREKLTIVIDDPRGISAIIPRETRD
ncbi:MAG: ZPR1 zinc finger domain-containing protein [Thermoplasmata archaeon]|nr:ZPR1 zinc finger domain-containing protein [Thermoplasmata archaeon]